MADGRFVHLPTTEPEDELLRLAPELPEEPYADKGADEEADEE